MNQPSQSSPRNNSKELLRYAGLGTQILAALGLAVFAGIKADKWLHTFPLLACILPLTVLSALFYKLFRETSRNGKK
jgi:Putative F0F1-ATPase subunit Ca2+/Mg2+ transporter